MYSTLKNYHRLKRYCKITRVVHTFICYIEEILIANVVMNVDYERIRYKLRDI